MTIAKHSTVWVIPIGARGLIPTGPHTVLSVSGNSNQWIELDGTKKKVNKGNVYISKKEAYEAHIRSLEAFRKSIERRITNARLVIEDIARIEG